MTPASVKSRLWLYFWIAVLSAGVPQIDGLPISDEAKAWARFALLPLSAGIIAVRSFIDNSNSEIVKPGGMK